MLIGNNYNINNYLINISDTLIRKFTTYYLPFL